MSKKLKIWNGTIWEDIAIGIQSQGIPAQTGNSGKYLTTDGATASWAIIPTPSAATALTLGTVFGKTESGQSYGNVALGENAGLNMSEGNGNTFIGDQSGGGGNIDQYSFANTAVGVYSLNQITTGERNVAIGYDTMYSNTSGQQNVAIGGEDTLFSNLSGSWNVVVGSLAAYGLDSSYNTIVGAWSGFDISTGQYNTLLGYQAGYNQTNGLTSGSNNIIIGNTAMPSAITVSNEITMGNSSISRFRIPGLAVDWTTSAYGRATYASTSAPSGGNNGDMWAVYV